MSGFFMINKPGKAHRPTHQGDILGFVEFSALVGLRQKK